MNVDQINSCFEGGGALFGLINVHRLVKDKRLNGVSWIPSGFFAAWGFWNLFYYARLEQWYSLACGTGLVIVNAVWLILVAIYAAEKPVSADRSLISPHG